MSVQKVDCVVVGAGVVGLACAAALARSGREVIVLEAEGRIGSGTSSRNSEVIHAGIYYPKNSLRARLCVEGRERLYAYCAERSIPHKRLGKLIVGKGPAQARRLEEIRQAALGNGVEDIEPLDAAQVSALEPEVDADRGLFSPSTGIIDSHALMLSLQGDLEAAGGLVALHAPVRGGAVSEDGILLEIGTDEPMRLLASSVVNSAGLHAPDLARSITGIAPDHIPPARYAIGHYYRLSGPSPCTHLVYPIPEEGGLGVHLTLDLAGQAKFGPDVRWIEAVDYTFDDSRAEAFLSAVRNYLPGVSADRLTPDYTGIRPKITGPGEPAADFRIDGPERHGIRGLFNLFGIESPGLTSSLAIAEYVAAGLRR